MRIWLASAAIFLCSPSAWALSNLTILADGSVSVAVSKLARDYARTHYVSVATSYSDQMEQSLQIHEGGAADVLITADSRWLDNLQEQGLLDVYSRMEFARGRMALIGPESSDLSLTFSKNFMAAPLVHAMNGEPELLLGNPEYVPEGKQARQALRNIGALDVLEPYTLYLKSTEEMIEQVTKRGAFAVLLLGQAQITEGARIIDVFAENTHQPVIYQAVVIAGDNMDAARQFMRYLATSEASHIIRSSGMTQAQP